MHLTHKSNETSLTQPNPTQLNLVPRVGFIGRVDLDLNFILSIVLYWVQVDDFLVYMT